jgi:hypothetical protein
MIAFILTVGLVLIANVVLVEIADRQKVRHV